MLLLDLLSSPSVERVMQYSLQRKLITIVCPVYNEEQTIPLFYERLERVLAPLRASYAFEVLFTNNRSTDNSLSILKSLRDRDPEVQILTLSRNFGYQASLQAGLSHANGDALIVVDVDCEDPLELIGPFAAKWDEGYDVVYGIRHDREESWVMKKVRNTFYRVLRIMADMDIVLYMAEFALVGSNVKDAIISNRNTFPFFRSEIGYAGFSRFGIPYKRQPRIAGRSHYNLRRMTIFALGGILTSSTFLMRAAAYLWPLLALFTIGLLISDFIAHSSTGFEVAVVSLLLYISFFVMIFGLYIARIYKNGMGRPVFIVDAKNSFLTQTRHNLDRRKPTPATAAL